MNEDSRKRLIQAFKKEKRGIIKARIHAICFAKIDELAVSEIAKRFYCDPQTVASWIQHYDEEGLAGLEDRPRSGRPPKVPLKQIEKVVKDKGIIITPKRLKAEIKNRYGVNYHITNVRRIMYRFGLSAKTVQRIHISRPEIDKIKRWQHNAKRRISRLESKGFATVVFDEAIFIDDPARGTKYWSPIGQPIITTYKGRHGRIVAYGAIETDGRQFFRTYKKFDKETVLRYIKELVSHFKKVVIIMDNAPQHKAHIVKEFLDKNSNVKVIWLPPATPELSVVEEYWHQSKREILVSEYYSTVVKMRHAMSEHFRTACLGLDTMKFISRKSILSKDF